MMPLQPVLIDLIVTVKNLIRYLINVIIIDFFNCFQKHKTNHFSFTENYLNYYISSSKKWKMSILFFYLFVVVTSILRTHKKTFYIIINELNSNNTDSQEIKWRGTTEVKLEILRIRLNTKTFQNVKVLDSLYYKTSCGFYSILSNITL